MGLASGGEASEVPQEPEELGEAADNLTDTPGDVLNVTASGSDTDEGCGDLGVVQLQTGELLTLCCAASAR